MSQDHAWQDNCFVSTDDIETNLGEIEDNLLALKTAFKGDTAPTSTEAGLFWIDTSLSTPIVKQRNKANDGWLTLYNLDSNTPKTTIGNHISNTISVTNTIHNLKQGHNGGIDADTIDTHHVSDFIAKGGPNAYADYYGTSVIVSADTERYNVYNTYVKVKEIRLNKAPKWLFGSTPQCYINVSFQMRSTYWKTPVYGSIRVNGVEKFSTYTTHETFQTFSYGLGPLSDGDLVQLYIKSGSIWGTVHARIKNFRILGSPAVIATLD